MPQELLPETLPVHIDSLRRAARGMTRTREDAEDLVQDTLLKVLARPRQIGPAGAGPYLHQALRNTHVSSLRTRDRRPCWRRWSPRTRGSSLPPPASRSRSCTPARSSTRSARCRRRSARSSPPSTSPASATARPPTQLQIPVGTVMSRLHRGRARLASYALAA